MKMVFSQIYYLDNLERWLKEFQGIGPVKAGNITQRFAAHGSFKCKDDMLRVPHVGKICASRVFLAIGFSTPFVMVLDAC